MKIKSNPFIEMEFGFEPGSTPDADLIYVVYRGHEPNLDGTLGEFNGGYKYVKDSEAAGKKVFPAEVICAFTEEADAQKRVCELNSTLGEDDVHYKYHGLLMATSSYAGLDINDVSTLGVVLIRSDECLLLEIEPVYSYQSEEVLEKKFSDTYENDLYDWCFIDLYSENESLIVRS